MIEMNDDSGASVVLSNISYLIRNFTTSLNLLGLGIKVM